MAMITLIVLAVFAIIMIVLSILVMKSGSTKKLVHCKDCGHKVSSKAWMCPGCGRKHPAGSSKIFWGLLILGILFLVSLFISANLQFQKKRVEQRIKVQEIQKEMQKKMKVLRELEERKFKENPLKSHGEKKGESRGSGSGS